jgi:hypothetical protein
MNMGLTGSNNCWPRGMIMTGLLWSAVAAAAAVP